jgi:hypothetical protein
MESLLVFWRIIIPIWSIYLTIRQLKHYLRDRLSVQAPVNEMLTAGNLEQSIRDLKYAIDNEARAEVLMEIVHMKIHPMLQSVYDLRLAVR